MVTGPNPVQFLPQGTPFTIPKKGTLLLVVTSDTGANLTFKASKEGRAMGYPDQFSITAQLNESLPVQGGIWDFVTLTNDATVTVTFGMNILLNALNQIASLSPNTPYLDVYNTTSDTILRSIERIVPRGGVLAQATVNESVASAGSGSSGPYSLDIATLVYLQLAISQDSLGTSPHDSYIYIEDSSSRIVYEVVGAVNSPLVAQFYTTVSGGYIIKWYNGDSVAHTFFASMYAVAT